MRELFEIYSLRPAWDPPVAREEHEEIRRPREVVDRVVAEAWETVAAAAWKHYSAKGRGLVSLEIDGSGVCTAIGYITAADTGTFDLNEREREILKDALEGYDPALEVLALGRFVTTNTVHVARRAAHQPSPPVAHRRQRN